MGELVARAYERTRRFRWVWLAMVLVIMVFSLLAISRAQFSRDLFDALPADADLQRYQALLKGGTAGQGRVVVGFHGDVPADLLAVRAERFAERLVSDHAALIDSILWQPDPAVAEALSEGLMDRMPLYADGDAVDRLAVGGAERMDSLMRAIRHDLARPGAELRTADRLMDPAGLTAPVMARVMMAAEVSGVTLVNGRLFAQDGSMALVFVFPRATDGDDAAFMKALDAEMAAATGQGVQADAFGAAPMAQANSDRIAKDALVTSLVAVVLILIILIRQYRSARVPLMFMVPPLVGFVIGLGMLAVCRPVVSALALGASAAMLGITLDYSFHFFTHLRHRRDMARTLKEIAGPMLLSSTTTVLAFAILSLTGSRVLADLGFLATFMLLGAAFTVLFVLPHFAPVPTMPHAGAVPVPRSKGRPARWALFFVVAVSVALFPFADEVTYDSDPEHLTWTPPGIKKVRTALEGTQRIMPVFLAGTGADEEQARRALGTAVAQVRQHGGVPSLMEQVMPTDLMPSAQEQARRLAHWQAAFGDGKGGELAADLRAAAERNGFKPEAFGTFLDRLNGTYESTPLVLPGAAGGVVLEAPGEVTVAGRLMVPFEELPALETLVAAHPGVSALHRGALGERIERLVGQDLERILLYTSLMVFMALLLIHGRIELALLTFLPMALAWVWILGLCGLSGISFNLVNILVCTFVFGLGDDYSIFTMEGLLERFRTGTDNTASFRQAVVLSVITTIIGTGVLLFAEHPALRSIAVLSVTGMAVLLGVALTLQPVLFRFFIGGRAERGLLPFTLRSFCIALFAFVYFLIGCVLLMLLLPVLLMLPMRIGAKRAALRGVMRLFCGSLVYIMVNTRKDIQSFRKVVEGRPSIVIANHSSFVDILVMLMITPRAVIMTNRWVWKSPFFGRLVRFAGHLAVENGMDVNVERVRKVVSEGLSVIIFPEGTRSRDGRIGRFHKGAFFLAEELQLPIVPVVLHGIGHAMPKGDAMLKDATLTMRTLPAIMPGDARFGQGPRERARLVGQWFREQYAAVRDARETPKWFRRQLVRTYTYKGPVLEWHTRIKARMDEELHEVLHARIARNAHVVDLGCGHGMVAQLLGWSAPERTVLGVDRDAEKVAIAAQATAHNKQMRFTVADLDTYEPPAADAFILKDVLHYLLPDGQKVLLQACAGRLNAGGSILVRDGFAAAGRAHERTRWTERLSTGLGFNKAKHALHFMTKDDLEAIAHGAGLRVEWLAVSARTSNQLAILAKPS